MARIWIDRIEALARRRIGRTAQVAALPPQPERLDANLWHLNRRPWQHGRYPGMLSRATGADIPVKQLLAEDRRTQETILATFTEYTLEQLLLMPELPSEIQLAIRENVALYNPSDPTADLLALYKPAGYHIMAEATNPLETRLLTPGELIRYNGPSIPAPCILREITLVAGSQNWPFPETTETVYEVEGYGVLFATQGTYPISNRSQGNTSRGLDRWILGGTLTPKITIRNPLTIPVNYETKETGLISVVCEPLVKL